MNRRNAIEIRYDILPDNPDVFPSDRLSDIEKIRENRRLAWLEVRRLAHDALFYRRAFMARNSVADRDEWQRCRKRLEWQIGNWRVWRGHVRAHDAVVGPMLEQAAE